MPLLRPAGRTYAIFFHKVQLWQPKFSAVHSFWERRTGTAQLAAVPMHQAEAGIEVTIS